MPNHLWVALGAVPGDRDVIALCAKSDIAEAKRSMRANAETCFVSRTDKLVYGLFDLHCGRPERVRSELKIYFRKIGFKEYELDGMVRKFVSGFAKAIVRVEQS